MNFFEWQSNESKRHNVVNGRCPHCQAWHHRFSLASHIIECRAKLHNLQYWADVERTEWKHTSTAVLAEMWSRG
jgi:hypothetical protein